MLASSLHLTVFSDTRCVVIGGVAKTMEALTDAVVAPIFSAYPRRLREGSFCRVPRRRPAPQISPWPGRGVGKACCGV